MKDMPASFHLDSEEDIRLLVARYFAELGFELDELSTEDNFTIHLGHNDIVIGAKNARTWVSARSDMLLIRQGHPFAVVELKAPDHTLTDDDARQGISYARLLMEMAPFAIVTNGAQTLVYDVLASASTPTPMSAIGDSSWYQAGERVVGMADDLRYEAARVLIGLNVQTLNDLCLRQVERALEDIKGTAIESKIYVPDAYTPRQQAVALTADWLESKQPCFALIGDSGLGKTTFLCAVTDLFAPSHFVLFYRALHLPTEGLQEALRREFVWEFQRDRDPAYIITRFSEIARTHGQKFIVIVDGLDEYRHSHEALQSELLDLAQRLRGTDVRLLISCKTHEWPQYIIEQEQSYNALAKSIFPTNDDVQHPLKPVQPEARHVGHWLMPFTDDEEIAAFARYAKVYDLRGRLTGTLKEECQVPLMMRLVAETYSGYPQGLPAVITSQHFYHQFWRRSMARLRPGIRTEAERLINIIATLTVESGQVLVPLIDIADAINLPLQVDEICDL